MDTSRQNISRAGQVAPALSLDGSIQSEGDRFQSALPKNHPDQAAMLADSHIERITYRKECLVNLSVGGAIMSIKQLKDGRYQVDVRPQERKESGFEKSLP